MAGEFELKIWKAANRIPPGQVASYGQIAKLAGYPGAARAAGQALKKNRSSSVPCHRVVGKDGRIGGYNKGAKIKEKMLIEEGIEINSRRISGIFFIKSIERRSVSKK